MITLSTLLIVVREVLGQESTEKLYLLTMMLVEGKLFTLSVQTILKQMCVRSVKVRALPLGIPFDNFVELAKEAPASKLDVPKDALVCNLSWHLKMK